jgi:predicted Zn-dependent protease with MMP-like domain
MMRISNSEFDRAVEQALREIPEEFRPHLDNIVVEVHARPSARLMREYDVPDDLLGLYVGTPLDEVESDLRPAKLPDRVLIFRDNLCEMCQSHEELIEEIRITVLHEVGHHFGLDEDRLADLGYD